MNVRSSLLCEAGNELTLGLSWLGFLSGVLLALEDKSDHLELIPCWKKCQSRPVLIILCVNYPHPFNANAFFDRVIRTCYSYY